MRRVRSRPALVLIAALALAAVPSSSQSWLLAYLAQTATMIVFALSYNLLLGETGLLSFGHAAYAGLGAFAAAHVFNRIRRAAAAPAAGRRLRRRARAASLFGFDLDAARRHGLRDDHARHRRTRRGAACGSCPDWFGGEGGVPIDRASGAAVRSRGRFGPAREAYALIAAWCVLACVAMFAFSRTPIVRLANAVRDNPVRAAAIGFDPRARALHDVVVSAFFAGIAGVLALINVELVSAESVGLARSGERADRDGDRRDGGVLRAGGGRGRC